MNDTFYEQIITKQGEMEVILEFPVQTENENSIKLEVNSIMLSALHEYMETF